MADASACLENVHKFFSVKLCKLTLVEIHALGYYIDVSTQDKRVLNLEP